MTHSLKEQYEDELMPDREQMFDNTLELKFEVLDKVITLDMGDNSHCPKEWRGRVDVLVKDFEDRFSISKLDLEITDKYTADLETVEGKKVVQKVRFLPNHRYNFAIKAIKQLEKAGVVHERDSEWCLNVVLVPKPVKSNELRSVTKADMQRGDQNTAELYRICSDFRELNNILTTSCEAEHQ